MGGCNTYPGLSRSVHRWGVPLELTQDAKQLARKSFHNPFDNIFVTVYSYIMSKSEKLLQKARNNLNSLSFDDFTIELIREDQKEWLAHFGELPNVSAYGDTPEEALQELSIAWEAMKASYLEHGEPIPVAPSQKNYSGQFNVRIDKRIHRALAIEAARAGVSLNALVAQKLALTTQNPSGGAL